MATDERRRVLVAARRRGPRDPRSVVDPERNAPLPIWRDTDPSLDAPDDDDDYSESSGDDATSSDNDSDKENAAMEVAKEGAECGRDVPLAKNPSTGTAQQRLFLVLKVVLDAVVVISEVLRLSTKSRCSRCCRHISRVWDHEPVSRGIGRAASGRGRQMRQFGDAEMGGRSGGSLEGVVHQEDAERGPHRRQGPRVPPRRVGRGRTGKTAGEYRN